MGYSRSMSIELYRKFTEHLPSTESIGEIVPYRWWEIQGTLCASRMPYVEMLQDFGYGLANSINGFTLGVRRVKAWQQVFSALETEEEQHSLIQEFIDAPMTLALLTPYVLRSRFLFASAHLCHQLNLRRGVNWSEEKLPSDDEIYFNTADVQGRPWARYAGLKLSLEKLGNKEFQGATQDFRNAFSHRFSPRVGFGITNFVSRQKDPKSGAMFYSFGGTLPFDLEHTIELLVVELGKCYAAYSSFRALAGEHTAYILEADAARN